MNNLKKILTPLLTVLALVFVCGAVSAQTVDSGAGGSATITINNASQGQTYTVYKLFDATVDGNGAISYKIPSGKAFTGNDFFEVDAKGNVTAKENADVSSDAFKTWAASFGTQAATAVAADNTLTFTNLAYGYYYVQSSLGATITVDSTNPDATIKDKNTTAPNIPDDNNGGGKHILVNGETVDSTTAKVGDTVNYQIKFEATNYVTTETDSKQITKYTIIDTPTNLSIDKSTVVVKVGDQTVTTNVDTQVDDSGKMTIVLTWADTAGKTIYNSPSTVVITYNATVTKGAADAAATNSATIGYNTADNPNEDPTPVDPDKPTDTTEVKTYQFTLNKVDTSSNQLTGATFKLYDAATDGNEIKVVKVSDGVYRVAEASEEGTEIEAGLAIIKGLKGDDTKYYLEETKAPNGYNILTERKEVTISSTETNTSNVINKAGAELPSTGSFGTKVFYLVGSILLIGALIFMISKRRMNNM
ncbi:LPXTG-motif cell wall anchor domain-containing protein [Streptococcus gallolyticus]|uniref:LPXTG-motif cell wall anchor domain-containing protein n=1 Tax=Streptococcus gallolyticus TaxID=315405 RepID=A0A1I7IV71_9STRE|nr:SpaH/EbpB family LPXTG-anchored major pilin [Streptococcus gallolyticus]SFC56622.1 LPXTG-motif cell wall anchor domain-containing protein [Streptococcus gallolyticus]SFU76824.1 LPXTG-motif cell wall anchor domain-containing protein [Streptococcus gallolyticus]